MPSGRIAVITGGDGGLAAAIQETLNERGWQVYAPGRMELDVTSPAMVKRYFQELGSLHLLVNNAGVRRDALLIHQSAGDRDTVLDVCLRGAFLCCREAGKLMAAAGTGHIVNIGSHSALTGPPGQTAYAAAKAALAALTKSLAAELGPSGVRVNCVLPGWLETAFTTKVPASVREAALAAQTLGKFNTVTGAARFIAGLDELDAVSGQVFCLDSRTSRQGT